MSQFGWEQLPHPLCSSDIASTEFHLYGFFKEFLIGTKYSSNEFKRTKSLKLRPKKKIKEKKDCFSMGYNEF